MNIFPGVSLGDTISFQIYPESIIGTEFKQCRITSVLDPKTANKFVDIIGLHANVFATLPVTVPDDPYKYSYVQVELPNGDTQVIGLPWIKSETVSVNNRSTYQFKIANISSEDVTKINIMLSSNGYSAIEWDRI